MNDEFEPNFDETNNKGEEVATPTIRPIAVQRKEFKADTVRVTSENLAEVANWSGGFPHFSNMTISYEVNRGRCKQIHAKIGDWVMLSSGGVNICTDSMFRAQFEQQPKKNPDAENERFAKVFQMVQAAMRKQDVATYHQDGQGEMSLVAHRTTEEIIKLFS